MLPECRLGGGIAFTKIYFGRDLLGANEEGPFSKCQFYGIVFGE